MCGACLVAFTGRSPSGRLMSLHCRRLLPLGVLSLRLMAMLVGLRAMRLSLRAMMSVLRTQGLSLRAVMLPLVLESYRRLGSFSCRYFAPRVPYTHGVGLIPLVGGAPRHSNAIGGRSWDWGVEVAHPLRPVPALRGPGWG